MSEYNPRLNAAHRSCNAIFSSSPFNTNKENRPPAKKPVQSNSQQELSNKETKLHVQSQRENKSTWFQTCGSSPDVRTMYSKDTKAGPSGMTRSKSVNSVLPKENSALSLKGVSDEKIKTPSKSSSKSNLASDKTPVTHFCTPRKINGTKGNGNSRTPMKRYLSERVLSTPECFSAVQMETPRGKQDTLGLDEQTVCEGENSNLTVGIRVRPLNLKELSDPKMSMIVEVKGQNITVACESSNHTFMYDHCFVSHLDVRRPENASQEIVFEKMVLPLVQDAFEGYNVCLFAYGQTGSGKSHSMMGSDWACTGSGELSPEAGIIPRFCDELFSRSSRNRNTTTTSVEISYFEIYNEKIHDLLASNRETTGAATVKSAPLKVREHPVFGPYVVDLSQHSVKNYEDLQGWLQVGNSQRATAATGMNEKSSRSHSIFSIILTQTRNDGTEEAKVNEASRRSKINLVDLAGSERLSQTCASGERLREGVSINKSLLILGKVIASLAENTNNRKRGFVPYRESVLTWLLKESLGGNSRTAMLGTVSPGNIHLEETLATLRYACQARAIVNRVHINEDPNDKLIRELKAEVLRLRAVQDGIERQSSGRRRLMNSGTFNNENTEEVQKKQREIDKLRDQLKRTEEQLNVTQKSWQDKLREAEEKKSSELKFLRRCGLAVEIDFRDKPTQPYLVNLAADPMLSGALLYLIPPGPVRIGKRTERSPAKSNQQLDIVLDGPLVKQLHCTIENNNGRLELTPQMDGDTYVNGQIVTGKVELKHGDRLVIGGNHYFKVCNPRENVSNKEIACQPVDFEFAHQEILTIQEEKLRAELEESKQKAIKDLENAKREIEIQLGTQKSTYEHEIEVLGSTLEKQKLALESINQRKKELEIEREILAHEVERNNRIKEIIPGDCTVHVTPYKSNFLQELEAILFETAADAEIALRMKLSNDAIKAGGVSLHEMQLLVREATETCREVAVNYEFHQQQMVVDKKLQPVIRVRDRDRMLETFWQPMHFLDWIHRLRDHEIEDSIKELRNSEDHWEPYDDSEIIEDSLNTSRISINITPVKKQLNDNFHQLSMESSILERTVANETTESTLDKRREDIAKCLQVIEDASKTLSRLCHEHESRETSGQVTKSLDKVHSIIRNLKNILDSKTSCDNNEESDTPNNSGFNNTVIENSESAISDFSRNQRFFESFKPSSATKPTLRENCPFFKDPPNGKTVRFDVS